MKPQLSLTATHVIDLQDQPDAEHVLFVSDNVGGSDAFTVDGVDADKDKVTGWRSITVSGSARETVVEVPIGTPWRLVSRGSLEMVTVEAMLSRRFEDEREMINLRTKYHMPEPPEKEPERLGMFL